MRGNFVRTLNVKKTGRRLFIHQAIKIRNSEHVLLLPLKGLYYEITMILPVLRLGNGVFSRWVIHRRPKVFRTFPKMTRNRLRFPKVTQAFRQYPKLSQSFPNISEYDLNSSLVFRRRPKHLDLPKNTTLKTPLRDYIRVGRSRYRAPDHDKLCYYIAALI